MNSFSNGPRPNGVICPICLEDCFNTWGLIEHMKTCHSGRNPDAMPSAKRFLLIALIVILLFAGDYAPTPHTAVNWNSRPVAVSWCPGCPENPS